MHFSLVYTVTAAILTVILPLVGAQGTFPTGTYRLQNMAFASLSPPRVLDLSDHSPDPGTPLVVFQTNGGANQHWNITVSPPGYNLRAVAPPSNAFVASLSLGGGVTGTPTGSTTFLFNKISSNIFQVIVASNNGTFAIQSTTDGGPVTLGVLDATNPRQIWRLLAP